MRLTDKYFNDFFKKNYKSEWTTYSEYLNVRYNNFFSGSSNFKSFLSGNALENTEKQYRDLVNKKSDKDLQNLPALNAELNSPFKPSKPISEQESLDKETGRLNRESNRTEIEKLKIKLSQLKQDPFNPKVNAEYDRVSALIEKKEKKSRDMIGYPLKEEEDDGIKLLHEARFQLMSHRT